LSTTDKVTLFAGLLAGAIVWWQGHLIRRQMELATISDLDREWNSEEMRKKRRVAWYGSDPDPSTIEDVLEFLEKVSTLEKEKFVPRGLIWDTFGWYMWRYYFYCREVISSLRSRWAPSNPDNTLYQDLEEFYPQMLCMELSERNCKQRDNNKLTNSDVEKELDETKEEFVKFEKGY
jgi:hypothetical protein